MGFTQKELDFNTNLYYFGKRYYDPNIGRWLTSDPLWGLTPWESPYAYCGNNPLIRKDEDGEFWNIVAGAGFGAALDAGFQMYQNYQSGARGSDVLKINVSQTLTAAAVGAAGAATGVGIVAATTKIVRVAQLTGTSAKVAQMALNVAGNGTANVAIGTVANGGNTDVKTVTKQFIAGAAGSLVSDGIKAVGNAQVTKKAIAKEVDNIINNEAIGDACLLRTEPGSAPTTKAGSVVQGAADAAGYIISNTPIQKEEEKK